MGKYRIATRQDIPDIIALLDKYIGVHFYSEDYLEGVIEDKNKEVFLYESEDGSIGGLLYILIATIHESCDIFNLGNEGKKRLIELYPDVLDQMVGVYKTILIREKDRGRGVAEQLVKLCADWFNSHGISYAFGEALVRPDGHINAKRHMDKSNQNILFSTEKPWRHIKSYCPYCGNEYCQCNGVIFVKEIKDGD